MPGKFSRDVRRFVKKTKGNIDLQVRAITLELFRSIILATPVDTGRARGNWQTSVGSPKTGIVARLDPTGQAALGEVVANLGGAGTVTWLANNLPYIAVLEYGEYPNPPKLGTYVPKDRRKKARADGDVTQAYEIRSAGGYSKQAPYGMVRVNFARVSEIVRRANVPRSPST